MIQVMYGRRGLGKTKRMIELANSALSQVKGDIVFIDDDSRCLLDLNHSIRYINSGEFKVVNPDQFVGFLNGILATNYDVEQIYMDGLPDLVGLKDAKELQGLFAAIEDISSHHNITLTLCVSGDPEQMPDFLRPYLLA